MNAVSTRCRTHLSPGPATLLALALWACTSERPSNAPAIADESGTVADRGTVDRQDPDAWLVPVPVGDFTLPEEFSVDDYAASDDGTLLLWDRTSRRVLVVPPSMEAEADFVLAEAVPAFALAPVRRAGRNAEILALGDRSVTTLGPTGDILHTESIPSAGLSLRDAALVGDTWFATMGPEEAGSGPDRLLSVHSMDGRWDTVDASLPFRGLLQASPEGPILVERTPPHRLAVYGREGAPNVSEPWEGFVDSLPRSSPSGGWEAVSAFPFEDGLAQQLRENGSEWTVLILYDSHRSMYKHPVFHGPEHFIAGGPGWMITLDARIPAKVTRYTWRWELKELR